MKKFLISFLLCIAMFALVSCAGLDGNGIQSIQKTNTNGLVDTYTITYTDGETSTFTVTNGKDGIDGIDGTKGEDGHTPVITIQNGNWYIDGVDTQVKAEGVKGDTGNGISSISKTATQGLVDTYTITYTNGETSTFTVTNGKDGINGIDGTKGEDGHTPVITIQNGNWYIDGVDTQVKAEGAKGDDGATIASVEFDEQGRLVITLTNGTVLDPVELPKKEEHIHDFSEWINVKQPACEEKGVDIRSCLECNYTESRLLEETGHTEEVTKKAVVATNEKSGLTAETKCSVCEKELTTQLIVSAKGYDWMITDNHLKILMIGNSYTEDASNCGQGVVDSQLYSLVQSMLGEDVNVTIGVIINGGKGMNWHATQAEQNNVCYSLQVITTENPYWQRIKSVSCIEALEWTDWDMISIQPYSINTSTGIESNAYPAQTDSKYAHISDSSGYLLDLFQKYAPQAEVYCYMHWAQTSSISMNAALSAYNAMATLYRTIETYDGNVTGKRFSDIVPVGLSVQNARTTYLSLLAYNTTAYADGVLSYKTDAQIGLQRDGGHLSFNIGRYIAALTFAEYLIPDELRADNYVLPDIRKTESIGVLPKEYTEIAQKSVFAAVSTWKVGNTNCTVIEGYSKDPTTLFAEEFADGIVVDFKINEENLAEFFGNQLYEDMSLEGVSFCLAPESEDVYQVTAKVRFGYTTKEFTCLCQKSDKAVITFTFDDGTSRDDEVYAVFDQYDLVCNFALITDSGNYKNRKDKYLDYEKQGFEILSHSATHTELTSSSLAADVVEKELKGSRDQLIADGFKNIRGWVTPYSTINSIYIEELKKYYDFGYTVYYGTVSEKTPYFTTESDPYLWSRVSMESSDLDGILDAIDLAVQNKGFIHFYAHGFNETQLTKEEMKTILDYVTVLIKQDKCIVTNVSDGYDYFYS